MSADAAAWEEMYRAYRDKVRKYVAGKVSNVHDAEDLVSSVFLKAYKKWESFDASRASPSTWLYSITRNCVIDYYRTRRVNGELPEELTAAGQIDDRLLQEETLEHLADALEQLSRRERDVILLHYYSGETLRVIAEKLHISYATVKLAHASALRKLRHSLDL